MIEFYSTHVKNFESCPKFDKKVLEMANSLTKTYFKHTDRFNVLYKGKFNFAKKRGAPKKTNRYGDIPRKIN
jgi:hypothetical protein